jgi:hypothetical protein
MSDFGISGMSGLITYFLGLDLGQRRDPAALVLVERAEVLLELDRVTYARRRAPRFRVLFLERVRLGTPYPDVVDRVREVVRRPALADRCTVVMDATGVGAPVLDMLRKANLGCSIMPVILTGGERASQAGGLWHVPKKDLITGLQVMLEKKELGLPANLGATRMLTKELQDFQERMTGRGGASFGAWREGQHDDLVIAAALACWRARWKRFEFWGTRSLGLG